VPALPSKAHSGRAQYTLQVTSLLALGVSHRYRPNNKRVTCISLRTWTANSIRHNAEDEENNTKRI